MKKPVSLLVTITCVFAAFVGGYHIGRSLNRTPVHIYQLPQPTSGGGLPQAEAETAPKALDINAASAEDFDALPGIGAVLAQRIVDYRTAAGGFRAVEELLNVSGIGQAKLEEILDLVTVETGGTQ